MTVVKPCDYCLEPTPVKDFAQDLYGNVCEFCAEALTMDCSECGSRTLTEDLTTGVEPLCPECNYAITRRV